MRFDGVIEGRGKVNEAHGAKVLVEDMERVVSRTAGIEMHVERSDAARDRTRRQQRGADSTREENGGNGGFDCDAEENAMLAEAEKEIVILGQSISHTWVASYVKTMSLKNVKHC